ncbi:DUF2092 domain-containing protein [Roseiarcus sp.]|uniref:DUF2092 domain-containing protein n=2 Tax=Roseiarcus sp. TaxID=1969460 RepID=UPI003C337E42
MIKSGATPNIRTLGLICSLALLIVSNAPVRAQTAEEQERSYRRESMEQALQTKERFDLYGLRFDSDSATIQPDSKSLLDDIATSLKNFPDWRLRIVGHTDATADPQHNLHLSVDRALAIKAALVDRGVDPQRLDASGLGESRPITSNATPEGRALNRRVELDRVTDSAEAKKMLKAMSDFLAAQKTLSVGFDTVFEVVTPTDQKLGLASSGTVSLSRPDKIRVARSGGFADFEILYDGKALTFLGKNANLYTQISAPGTVDQLIDTLQEKYNRPLPGADLLMTNSYDELMQDVYDSKDLGSGVVNGVECDTLTFRKNDVDWQIWIAQGERPYPCRFVITSKLDSGDPQYTIQFRDWKFGNDVAADDFAFKNASNAKQVDVKDVQDKLGDLPENFTIGGAK